MSELYHYGVKGMKWGVRKKEISTAKSEYKNKKKAAFKKYEDSISDIEKPYKRGQNLSKGDMRRESAAENRYRNEIKKAKSDYKNAKIAANKKAVKEYSKQYEEANKMKELANSKWDEVNKLYKSLGKNTVTRMLNARKNQTDAAKKYNKLYDEASELSDLADQRLNEINTAYLNTGSNRIERVLNNAKYG